jgi:hypothetical protein
MTSAARSRRRAAVAAGSLVMAAALATTGPPVAAATPATATTSSVTGAMTAAAAEPLLVPGMRGSAVARWQRAANAWLAAEGRSRLAVDGVYGPRTLAATRAVQRAGRVAVDGIVGPQTRGALARLVRGGQQASFEGTVGLAEQAAGRGPVAVTDVRFGYHDGFDRVVFDLAGPGRAGWQVRYVDSPVRQQGSGNVVPLAGDGQLQVVLTGISMPGDVGGLHYDGPDRPALGRRGVVEDLFVGNLFEGRFATWIGTASPERFRVFALDAPQRVVVDIAHGPARP